MTSQWRHNLDDVIKSVKIGNSYNFWTKIPLKVIDPSFFVFCDALYEKLPFGGSRGQIFADVSIFDYPTSWWRHRDVTWRHHVGCRIFWFGIIPLIIAWLLAKFEVNWVSFSQDTTISILVHFYRISRNFRPRSDKPPIIFHRIMKTPWFFPETCKTKSN